MSSPARCRPSTSISSQAPSATQPARRITRRGRSSGCRRGDGIEFAGDRESFPCETVPGRAWKTLPQTRIVLEEQPDAHAGSPDGAGVGVVGAPRRRRRRSRRSLPTPRSSNPMCRCGWRSSAPRRCPDSGRRCATCPPTCRSTAAANSASSARATCRSSWRTTRPASPSTPRRAIGIRPTSAFAASPHRRWSACRRACRCSRTACASTNRSATSSIGTCCRSRRSLACSSSLAPTRCSD